MRNGVVITDISNHFGTFADIPISLKPLAKKTSGVTHIRDMKNFNIEIFIEDLSEKVKLFDTKYGSGQFSIRQIHINIVLSH